MFLGIDLGTTELKLVLLSDSGDVRATTRVPLAVSRPQPLWSEQHPEDWWRALEAGMSGLASSHSPELAAVRGIGLSGQMHGAVLLDRRHAVLRPAILWNDGRSRDECVALAAAVPALDHITGTLPMPGFTAPKLLWVRTHEPEMFGRTACVLLPKDYLRLRLTGELISDCSDASGTLWLDVAARAWSEPMLGACGLSPDQMPAVVEGSAPGGLLRAGAAAGLRLPAGIPVAGGGGDNAASAVGIGAVDAGQGFVSLGTSGVIFVVSDGFRPNPAFGMHAFCHALPDRWHQMSVMLSAASCLAWAVRLTGLRDEAELIRRATALSPTQRAQAPIFLPYLSGERTPHNDVDARGVLFGLTHEHDAASVAWSVMEGVCFGLLDGLRSMGGPAGSGPAGLDLVGGGARNAAWSQLLASTLGHALRFRPGNELGAALGAARLGWLASGGHPDDVLRQGSARARIYEPLPAQQADIQGRHERFRALYGALRENFRH